MSKRFTPNYAEQIASRNDRYMRRTFNIKTAVYNIGNAAYALYPDMDALSVAESINNESTQAAAPAPAVPNPAQIENFATAGRDLVAKTETHLSENEQYINSILADVAAAHAELEDTHEFRLNG